MINGKKKIKLYLKVIEILNQKEYFIEDEIDQYQLLTDEFYKLWIDLHGDSGITNYFHMIGSGHLKYYLIK